MTLRADHVAGAAAVAAGAIVLSLSGDLPLGSLSFPGAGMWPKLLCGALILFGLALAIRPQNGEPVAAIDWGDLAHAARVMALTATAVALYARLGFILSMGLLLASLVALERRSIVSAALYGAGVSVATYALFSFVLKSPLERGLLGF